MEYMQLFFSGMLNFAGGMHTHILWQSSLRFLSFLENVSIIDIKSQVVYAEGKFCICIYFFSFSFPSLNTIVDERLVAPGS